MPKQNSSLPGSPELAEPTPGRDVGSAARELGRPLPDFVTLRPQDGRTRVPFGRQEVTFSCLSGIDGALGRAADGGSRTFARCVVLVNGGMNGT